MHALLQFLSSRQAATVPLSDGSAAGTSGAVPAPAGRDAVTPARTSMAGASQMTSNAGNFASGRLGNQVNR